MSVVIEYVNGKNLLDNTSSEYIRPPKLPNLSELFPNKNLKTLQSYFLKSEIGLTEEEFYQAVNEILGEGVLSEHHICRLFRQTDCFSRGRSLLL
jgi:hypothetical protein